MSWEAWIPVIASGLGAAGAMAGRASQNRATGRAAEADLTMQRDRDTSSRYAVQQQALLQAALMAEQAKLNRARLGIEAPAARANQAARGDALANVQDVSISGVPSHITVPQISGGLRPSALGPNARAAGRGLSAQALEALLSGSDVPEMPDYSGLAQAMPEQSALPEATGTDRFLSILAALGAASEGASTVAGQRRRGGTGAPSAGRASDLGGSQWAGLFGG
jgi:hypothetical protein